MLHLVPDSVQRRRLLRVVVFQRRLIEELCALPEGETVDLPWLQNVWNELSDDWVRRVWENDSGRRETWINQIAAASATDKQTILDIAAEQFRFPELYSAAPSVTFHAVDWSEGVFDAVNKLLKSFYAPLLYVTASWEGYPAPCAAGGAHFHKDTFIGGFPNGGPRVCPYCDNYLQVTELDHFFPKDAFPFLSCHPDNLIPSCHDSNRGCNKGTTIPLTLNAAIQANDWFHPRLRSAEGCVRVSFYEADGQLRLRIDPVAAEDQRRVENLDRLFGLTTFWGQRINPDIQQISRDVSVLLSDEPFPPSEDAIRTKLQHLAALHRGRIGSWALAIPHSHLYEFCANSDALVQEILRLCIEDGPFQQAGALED